MTPDSQGLEFSPTPLAIGFGVVFLVVVALLAFLSWKRSGFRKNVGLLETLRFLIALIIAITLLQPEWQQIFLPDEKPSVAVLYDTSGSMETRDILDPDGATVEPRSRADLIAPLVDPAAWSSLTEKLDVIHSPFNSALENPIEATDLNAALDALPEQHPNLGAVVLITDGDWNTGGSPAVAATRLRMQEVPVFTVSAGSPEALPDIEIAGFDVPVFAVAAKPLRIPFTVRSTLPRDEAISLTMTAPAGETVQVDIVAPAMGQVQDSILWRPSKAGEVTLTLTAPKTGTEIYTDNNTLEATLDIRKEQLRVLVIETYPRWEYRYLRNALERDPGVEVNCLLLHPGIDAVGAGRGYLKTFPTESELSDYDVVFLGDVGAVPGQLGAAEIENLRKLVRDQASGLVFLPGLRGYQSTLLTTELGELLPVVLDEQQPRGWGTSLPGKFVLTEAGTRSLLTKLEDTDEASAMTWGELPGFHWYAPALRAKVGTEILATHGTETTRFGRVPLIVTRTYGAGKVLFMGSDGAWRWRKGVEDKYHYRFWGQVVRWMAYQRNMAAGDKMRLFYSPDRPQSGETLTLNANVMSSTGEPLREGTVVAEISAPSGSVSSVRLAPGGGEAWGLFTGVFTPSEAGLHKLRLTCAESGAPLEIELPVQGTTLEQRGQPARPDVLQEISQLTRGTVLPSTDPATVVAAIAALPDPEPEIRRLPIWSHPAWAGLLLVMLAVFWIGRKMAGMF